MNAPNRSAATPSPLRQVLATQRPLFVRAAWFSLISGVLMLAPSWFMFEVYGRVLNSRNEKTLWMLLLMVVGVYAVVEMLELVRGRILQKVVRFRCS